MKKIILTMILCLTLVGCSTVTPTDVGFGVGVAYELTKDRMSQDQLETVQTAYKVFHKVVQGEDLSSDFEVLLLDGLEKLELPIHKARLVIKLFDFYLQKLEFDFNLSELDLTSKYRILQEFDQGIQMAILEATK